MAGCQKLLSVGIDIGTSTTQVLFSRLTLEDDAGYFVVPHISITEKEVVYKGNIFPTPLKKDCLLDTGGLKEIIASEYACAGVLREEVETGAVIITGEAARKENASAVLRELGPYAGDFVVQTAGPDLESIIAGKGSGACAYSMAHACRTLNIDIGGGTSNAVLFENGEALSCGCLDIGGRLVTVGTDGRIAYVSESAGKIARSYGIRLKKGDVYNAGVLRQLTHAMAQLLCRWALGAEESLLKEIETPGSSVLSPGKADVLFFSGGVGFWAGCGRQEDENHFGDIGILLGRQVRDEAARRGLRVAQAEETLRATVIGAASYTTTVSGSTIRYSADIFPLKNIPVLRLAKEDETRLYAGESAFLSERLSWFLTQNDTHRVALSFKGKRSPSYEEMDRLGRGITRAFEGALGPEAPFIVITEEDIGKALGVFLGKYAADAGRDIVCIDCIRAEENDFVDFGHPVMDGLVIPVVVKTMITG